MGDYVFAYHEFDMLRESVKPPEQKLEKATGSNRSSAYSTMLQEARIRQRLSIGELAARVGLPARLVSLYESGAEVPPESTQRSIGDALGLSR